MSLLVESIYLNHGVFRNLSYHQARMQRSSLELFNAGSQDLLTYLNEASFPKDGLYKTRITYDKAIRSLEFIPYEIKPVKSLKIVSNNQISYSHKFMDRSGLERLHDLRENADEILIVKNGLITDSSYSNIIFKKDNTWFTPKSYLLNGTMRQNLLAGGRVREAHITSDNYRSYVSCKLINAMLCMESPEILIEAIS